MIPFFDNFLLPPIPFLLHIFINASHRAHIMFFSHFTSSRRNLLKNHCLNTLLFCSLFFCCTSSPHYSQFLLLISAMPQNIFNTVICVLNKETRATVLMVVAQNVNVITKGVLAVAVEKNGVSAE